MPVTALKLSALIPYSEELFDDFPPLFATPLDRAVHSLSRGRPFELTEHDWFSNPERLNPADITEGIRDVVLWDDGNPFAHYCSECGCECSCGNW